MATKYVLNIDPKISSEDAKKTEQQLNSRFRKVAKNYGDDMEKQNNKITSGFSSKMKMALSKLRVGWIALAGAVASVLTNPFDEVDSKLNELLAKFDNTATRAQQWGVDATRYWLYQQVGSIAGVKDTGVLDNALLRIADKLEQARTGEDDTLKNYLGEKDIIDVFYKLAQEWNKMTPTARAASMADILGARQANQFAELVQSDWNELAKTALAGYAPRAAQARINTLGDLERQQAINRAQLATRELFELGGTISGNTIQSQMSVELARQDRLRNKMQDYGLHAATEKTAIETKQILDDGKSILAALLDVIKQAFNGESIPREERQKRQNFWMKQLGLERDVPVMNIPGIEIPNNFGL